MKRFLAGFALWIGCLGLAFLITVALSGPAGPTVHAQIAGVPWTCSVDNVGAALVLCQPASADLSVRRYVTDVVAQSTTATAGQFLLQYGTGTACATGTVSLLPSSATVIRIAAPGNGSAPALVSLRTPLVIPSGKDLCLLGVVTNTVTAQISGYLAP